MDMSTLLAEIESAYLADSPRVIMTVVLFLGFAIVETLYPGHTSQSVKGRIQNIMLAFVYLLLGSAVTAAITLLLAPKFSSAPAETLGAVALVCLAYLIIFDFLYYWYHRAQHTFRFLWPIHELHHSDRELNATTAMRTFWLEIPLQATLLTLPAFYLVGYSPEAALLFSFLTTGWVIFSHANIRLRLGPLTRFFCAPQTHRIHHSVLANHHNKNFAMFFPANDIIFGTYYHPARDEFPPTGIKNKTAEASVTEIFLGPFVVWISKWRSRNRTL